MKKIAILKLLFLGAFLMVFNQSCTDLEEELFDQVTPDNFFKSDEEFISALGAAYTSLYGHNNTNNVWMWQEVPSDEMCVPTRGQDWDDGGHWVRKHTQQYTTDDTGDGWNFCFGGINTCNRLIFQFDAIEVEGKDAFLAELKTLRALFYYWLLDLWGNVPLVTQFDVPADFAPANESREAVYAFVEQEVENNINLLSKSVDGTTYGRMHYYVAKAILAKLYLNAEVYTGKSEWVKAVAACDEIINSGLYSLESNYFNNFKTENDGSKENIFVIPFDEVFAGGFNLPAMTLHYGSQATFNLTFQPWNGFCSLQEFYESYSEDDVRRANFITGPQFASDGVSPILDTGSEPSDPDGTQLNFTPEINELRPGALRQAGARVGKYEFKSGATSNLSNDYPIFRYGDILLIKAESLFRQGNTADALVLVNQIRERAGVEVWDTLTEDMLLSERGREMFAEAIRRQDLIRFGKFNDAWWEKPASDPHVNILPIPRSALDANKNLQQNPGY